MTSGWSAFQVATSRRYAARTGASPYTANRRVTGPALVDAEAGVEEGSADGAGPLSAGDVHAAAPRQTSAASTGAARRRRRSPRGRADNAGSSSMVSGQVSKTLGVETTPTPYRGHATAGDRESERPTLRWTGPPETVRKTVTRSRALARPTRPAATVAALALVGALGLAGCDAAATAAPPRSRPRPAPRRRHPAAPAETESTPVADAAEPPARRRRAARPPARPRPRHPSARSPTGCCPARRCPGSTRSSAGSTGKTRTSEGRALFGTCQRFGITSIGATEVAVRDYRPAQPDQANPPAEAGELVARAPRHHHGTASVRGAEVLAPAVRGPAARQAAPRRRPAAACRSTAAPAGGTS